MVTRSIAWKTGTRSTNCSSNRWDTLGDDDTKFYEMWTMFYRKVGALFGDLNSLSLSLSLSLK